MVLLVAAPPADAHPGSGIAVDAHGRVFVTVGPFVVLIDTNGQSRTIVSDPENKKFYQLHHIRRAPDGGLLTDFSTVIAGYPVSINFWVERATGPFCRATSPTAVRTTTSLNGELRPCARLGGKLPPRTAKLAVPVRLRGCAPRTVQVRFPAAGSRGVSKRNCVAARRGGEQRNENEQSVTRSQDTGTR
jgi:hypothetical protein